MSPYIIIQTIFKSSLHPVQQDLHCLPFVHSLDGLFQRRIECVLDALVQRRVGIGCPTGSRIAFVASLRVGIEEIDEVLVHAHGSRHTFLGTERTFGRRLTG